MREIGRLRDVARCWPMKRPIANTLPKVMLNAPGRGGFRVLSARASRTAKAKWVNGQLDMTPRRLPKLADWRWRIGWRTPLRRFVVAGWRCGASGGLRHGRDYVAACEPV